MAKFILTKVNSRKVFSLLHDRNRTFLEDVRRRWSMDAWTIIALINRKYLTRGGAKSLKNRTGKASKVLMSKTTVMRFANQVVNRFFLDKNNPASVYLPVHDKSYKGSRTIKAKRSKYMKFKTADGNWVTTRQVYIPQRLDLMPILEKRARKKFVISVNESLKVFAR